MKSFTVGKIKTAEKPIRYTGITARMRLLKVGQCLDASFTHRTAPYSFAKTAGIKVSVRQLPNGLYRVWREE